MTMAAGIDGSLSPVQGQMGKYLAGDESQEWTPPSRKRTHGL